MITLSNVTVSRGQTNLLENASLTIHAGKKIGLIGRNGCGKSTLMDLLRGKLKEDLGDFKMPRGLTIHHVSQHAPDSPLSALDYVLAGHPHYGALQKKMAEAIATDDHELLAKCHQRMDEIDGYSLLADAAQLLYGLGFASDLHQQCVNDFSGGWRVRLHLAQALLNPCDLLLLDEPTNHLDLDALVWLEKWLRAFRGTVVVIAHDAAFLNSIVDTIVHIEGKQCFAYQGTYDQFVRQRAEKMRLQEKFAQKVEQKRNHMMAFINRFKAKASKAKQAQSRLKALNRLEDVASIHIQSPYQIELFPIKDCPNPLIRVQKLEAGYDFPILRGVSMYIGPQDRIGLLGPNGAGKSTLIKTLAGELALMAGERQLAKDLKIGYFAQHQLDQLEGEASALMHLQKLAPYQNELMLRGFLGNYGFSSEKALIPVSHLSGGEQARLTLALIIWQKPHCLLLDEPTNHLDIEMREALSLALQSFEGAVVLISHDRELLTETMNQFHLVADGTVQDFQGDMDEYVNWLKEFHSPKAKKKAKEKANDKDKRKEDNKIDARAAKKSLQNKCQQLEKWMNDAYSELKVIEFELGQDALYQAEKAEKLADLLKRQIQLKETLVAKESEWLQAQEELTAYEN